MQSARIVVTRAGGAATEISLGGRLRVGRVAENDLVLDDPGVSRRHAELRQDEDGSYVLLDLGSANGTELNGRILTVPSRLRDGDIVKVGAVSLSFRQAPEPERDETPTGELTMVSRPPPERTVLGTSRKMTEVFRLMETAAASPIPVLIEGETGTGKELVARGIHEASRRGKGPFIAVNCAAVTESLLESELFGHRRGAFTGALQDHRGLFEAASGGTIFLDEVGEMPASMQAKLLRVLEEGEIVPVGETRPRKIDVRVISATNRDLAVEVERKGFRSDLYFRLAAFPMRLPPLRERRDDIPLLAKSALATAALRHGKRVPGFGSDALDALVGFHWPGNVRELRNEIQRAVALTRDGEPIQLRHLSEKITAMAARPSPEAGIAAPTPGTAGDPSMSSMRPSRVEEADARLDGARESGRDSSAGEVDADEDNDTTEPESSTLGQAAKPVRDIREARAGFEARFIIQVLAENGGHIGKTAQALGLSRVALHKKLKEYGIRARPERP